MKRLKTKPAESVFGDVITSKIFSFSNSTMHILILTPTTEFDLRATYHLGQYQKKLTRV